MKILSILIVAILFMACQSTTKQKVENEEREKFEPAYGECILFAGQDLGAVGGVDGYTDGYMNYFDTPGGFTMYTNLRTGDVSYGNIYRGLDGIWDTDNWGSGDCNMSMQINDLDFKHMALAIGFELVNHEKAVARGEFDNMIDSLGNWFIDLGERPVFLRIGYEFDGHEWNHYDRESYIAAFKHIRVRLDSLGVENVAYVWQSKGWGSDYDELENWYPGDEYVDWCGYSFFSRGEEAQPMLDFARDRKKPVFIAEATPMFDDENGNTLECDLDNPDQAKKAWDEWFTSLFKTIDKNPDIIKAVSYINVNWRVQDMWQNPPFSMCDSRMQASDYVSRYWQKETSKEKYLKASPMLWKNLRDN